MRRKLHPFLWFLSGDDKRIINDCHSKHSTFALIGGFVLFTFIICFLSCFIAFNRLFSSNLIAVGIALVFSWMITNIYLLLLYTLSKSTLPHVSSPGSKWFSLSVRFGFIIFLGICISKPIEVFVFEDYLNPRLDAFKSNKKEQFEKQIRTIYDAQRFELDYLISGYDSSESTLAVDSKQAYIHIRGNLDKKEDRDIQRMNKLVGDSTFFLDSIKILSSTNGLSWIITLFIVCIILIPALLKQLVPINSDFYESKKKLELSLVLSDYNAFRSTYKSILIAQGFPQAEYLESFEDPPFNTVKKSDKREFYKQDELLGELYGER